MAAPRKVTKSVAGLLALGLLLATPAAAAFGMGVDAASVDDMKDVGATPQFAQLWVGSWVLRSGWSSIEAGLREARDAGATPVIQYYYWGDSISVSGVKYGQEGRTQSQWFSLAKETATRAKNIMGDRPFLMVLEPEFNKNGIQHWEDFDGMLAKMASDVKYVAPKAKIVTGFGYWNDGHIFDRAVAKSDYVGFMLLRASTRDSSSTALGAADQVIDTAKSLNAKWGKDVIVFDLGIATYGGWEWVQEQALQKFIDKRAALDAAGVKAIVWRYVYDNSYSSGYFGAAESSWGVKYAGGGSKRGYDELVRLIKGSATSTTTPTAPSGGAFDASFTDIQAKDWWVEVTVTGNEPIAKVEASVNGGAYVALTKQWWGDYAKSLHVPSGANVVFRATSTSGAVDTSASAAPAPAPSTGSFDASFSDIEAKDWWVEVTVKGNEPIAKVEASVDGGAYIGLVKQSWGDYAKSIRVPAGASVVFRATSTSGATDTSDGASAAPAAGSLSAKFTPKTGNAWWIQVDVDASKSLKSVEARVNGGDWKPLALKSWGDWAASYHAPSGSRVEFRATATDGTSAQSTAYTW